MSEKTLKLNNIRLNKKEFNKSKEPIDLMSVNIDQIVASDKFKHSDEDFKYVIGYREGEKAAEYYAQNKEAIKEKSREHYKNLLQEKKDKIKEHQRKKYQELVQYKKEAVKNNFLVFA